jgi:lauroyl/myristoyl acyltransferase
MHPGRGATIIRMFGRPASVSFFHCALAQRGGVPLVPVIGLSRGRGWSILVCDTIHLAAGGDPAVAAQRCWDVMEKFIREHPEQWLWMYKHWRYRPADAPPGNWPVYAKPDASFDRLLRETAPSGAAAEKSPPDAPLKNT